MVGVRDKSEYEHLLCFLSPPFSGYLHCLIAHVLPFFFLRSPSPALLFCVMRHSSPTTFAFAFVPWIQ